ncbi:unnamed protein product [Paramecium octaurelia]|uniref:Uncharacterized protein n=1 Tax=Paramecium octaurelia TaxID=43137 RepID=A0A8S1XQB3_PAROT|nr:unnamed protein product [Paramecium octaurelia]
MINKILDDEQNRKKQPTHLIGNHSQRDWFVSLIELGTKIYRGERCQLTFFGFITISVFDEFDQKKGKFFQIIIMKMEMQIINSFQ